MVRLVVRNLIKLERWSYNWHHGGELLFQVVGALETSGFATTGWNVRIGNSIRQVPIGDSNKDGHGDAHSQQTGDGRNGEMRYGRQSLWGI